MIHYNETYIYNKVRMLFWGAYDFLLYKCTSKKILGKKRPMNSEMVKVINDYYSGLVSEDKEIIEIQNYINKRGLNTVFPYQFARDYEFLTALRFGYDRTKSMFYGSERFGRVYLKHNSFESAYMYYHELICEQDKRSPHLYSEKEVFGRSLFDIGAAEGIYSLKNANNFDSIVMMEGDESWVAALQNTFHNFSEKVKIVNSFVGEGCGTDTVSVDSYFLENGIAMRDIVFKIDVEGMELEVLRGMENVLRKGKNISVFVCTYHNEDDEGNIRRFFDNIGGFRLETSKGYMIMYYDKDIKAPYVRRGVLRAYKLDDEE